MGLDLKRFDRRRAEAYRRRTRLHRLGGFDPRQIPEIVAGYFWDPAATTGSGATIAMPEGNGKTSYNMVTAAAGTAPTTGTVNGQAVIQFANLTPDQMMRTNATVQRGWTGATYFAFWFQSSGAVAVGSVVGHWRTANNFIVVLGNTTSGILGDDGGGAKEYRWNATPCDGNPHFIEAFFDPTAGATGRFRYAQDGTENFSYLLNPATGTTITDTSEYLTIGGTVADSSIFNFSSDFKLGMFYVANGIPSAANRALLRSHKRLA